MKAALTEYLSRLDDMRTRLRLSRFEEGLLSGPSTSGDDSTLRCLEVIRTLNRSRPVVRKRALHEGTIVGLYGAWEQFVEAILRRVLIEIRKVHEGYSDIPSSFRDAHSSASYDLIGKLPVAKFPGLTEAALVENLHSCLSNSKTYALNAQAFLMRTANLKAKAVKEALGRVDVDSVLASVRQTEPYSDYVFRTFGSAAAGLQEERVFSKLDDLVERRNEVAHGSVASLLGPQDLTEFIDYMEVLGKSLLTVVQSRLIERLIRNGTAFVLDQPLRVIRNRVVCFSWSFPSIEVGDWLVCLPPDSSRPIRSSPIARIEVGGRPLDRVPKRVRPVNIGCEVSFHAKPTHRYYLIKSREVPA